MDVLLFIYRNLDQFRKRFLFVFLSGFLDGIATFAVPVLLSALTQHLPSSSYARFLIIGIIFFYFFSLGFQWIIRKWGEALGPQFADHLRLKYFEQLEQLPHARLAENHSGYLLSLINNISESVKSILFNIFWQLAKGISTTILFFYFTARESIFMACVNLLILVLFVGLSGYLSRRIIPLADALNKKRAALLASYADFMANILTVKRLGIHFFAEEKLHTLTTDNAEQIQHLQTFHAKRWFLLHGLFGIAFLTTISFLVWKIFLGTVSPSVLILFIAAYSIMRTNIGYLSESYKGLVEMRAYIERLHAILKDREPEEKGMNLQTWRDVSFTHISFQYPGTEKSIRIPSFHLSSHEKICLTGKSGEGKTTFLHLFTNALRPDQGERSIDGHPYSTISSLFFQQQMTVISQETELFNLSLRENMTLGQPIAEKELYALLEAIDLREWVQHLDQGLDTLVGEKGLRLSAGQKQRVNLIRGILLNRPIILLDEPTSHLDERTERKVIDFLKDALKNKTVLIISHREALRELCTRSYRIENHVLEEDGGVFS